MLNSMNVIIADRHMPIAEHDSRQNRKTKQQKKRLWETPFTFGFHTQIQKYMHAYMHHRNFRVVALRSSSLCWVAPSSRWCVQCACVYVMDRFSLFACNVGYDEMSAKQRRLNRSLAYCLSGV